MINVGSRVHCIPVRRLYKLKEKQEYNHDTCCVTVKLLQLYHLINKKFLRSQLEELTTN